MIITWWSTKGWKIAFLIPPQMSSCVPCLNSSVLCGMHFHSPAVSTEDSSGRTVNCSLLLGGCWFWLTHQRVNTTSTHLGLFCSSGRRREDFMGFLFSSVCSNSQHLWKNVSTLQRLSSTIYLKANNGMNFEALSLSIPSRCIHISEKYAKFALSS